MEQHLHPQCSERSLLCLSNYIYSKVLDNSQRRGKGSRGGGGGGREERLKNYEDCEGAKDSNKQLLFYPHFFHTHTNTHSVLQATLSAMRYQQITHTKTTAAPNTHTHTHTGKKNTISCSHERGGREDGPRRHMCSIMLVTTTRFIC